MPIISAYMVPHPPMIVPDVGRGSERQVEATRAAYMRVAEDIAALNHKLGADLPFYQQFFNYLKNILFHFDFGTSYLSGKPVFDSIMARFPTTFKLALLSIVLSSIVGIALGVLVVAGVVAAIIIASKKKKK